MLRSQGWDLFDLAQGVEPVIEHGTGAALTHVNMSLEKGGDSMQLGQRD